MRTKSCLFSIFFLRKNPQNKANKLCFYNQKQLCNYTYFKFRNFVRFLHEKFTVFDFPLRSAVTEPNQKNFCCRKPWILFFPLSNYFCNCSLWSLQAFLNLICIMFSNLLFSFSSEWLRNKITWLIKRKIISRLPCSRRLKYFDQIYSQIQIF